MTKIWEGRPDGAGARFGIIVARFNSGVTDRLLDGAMAALSRTRVGDGDVEVVRVPGAFEIPIAAKRLAETGRVEAVVCLGAIVKGGTPHWDYLSDCVTKGISRASLETNIPMTNAVLTTETLEQAAERAETGDKKLRSNKGYDAALAAVELAELFRQWSER